MNEREKAAYLQTRADQLRDPTATHLHRRIQPIGGGWVQIQADYLDHLLSLLGHASR